MRKKILLAAIIIIILVAVGFSIREVSLNHTTQQQVAIHSAQQKIPVITYRGKNGQNALKVLKQYTSVQQDNSGLVVAINGYKPVGHTYWAFYVNGKLASVGPASYITKNSDVVTWKIEKY